MNTTPLTFPTVARRLLSLLLLALLANGAVADTVMRVALDDIPGVDMLPFLVAAERCRDRGIDIRIEYLQSEDLAAQAVISGQADVGMGTPYGLILRGDAPLRLFYQLSKLRFFPVVNSRRHDGWKDLHGAEIHVHGPGSGTEAIMRREAKRHGIEYGKVTYVPGSGVRARAMQRNRIHASIVDLRRRDLLLSDPSGRFKLLPVGSMEASDEALYVSQAFLAANQEALSVLVAELLQVWRRMVKEPEFIIEQWRLLKLFPAYSAELEREARAYLAEMIEAGAFPLDGGGVEAARDDIEFYTNGDNAVSVERFWSFTPLESARSVENSPGG